MKDPHTSLETRTATTDEKGAVALLSALTLVALITMLLGHVGIGSILLLLSVSIMIANIRSINLPTAADKKLPIDHLENSGNI